MSEHRFTWRRFQVLVMLDQHGELYGAQMNMSSGALYPALKELERSGMISARRETGDQSALGRRLRVYYKITPDGRRELREMLATCGLELVALGPDHVEGAFPLL